MRIAAQRHLGHRLASSGVHAARPDRGLPAGQRVRAGRRARTDVQLDSGPPPRARLPDAELRGASCTEGVVDLDDLRDLFLLASQPGPAQRDACRVLKVMHVIHHVDGRELLFRMPIASLRTLPPGGAAGLSGAGRHEGERGPHRRVQRQPEDGRLHPDEAAGAAGQPGGRGARQTSVPRGDGGPLGRVRCARLPERASCFAFNYVVPGASRNDLVDFRRTVEGDPGSRRTRGRAAACRSTSRRSSNAPIRTSSAPPASR
jgi:hypothetical protein